MVTIYDKDHIRPDGFLTIIILMKLKVAPLVMLPVPLTVQVVQVSTTPTR